jgi:hypothetical protein
MRFDRKAICIPVHGQLPQLLEIDQRPLPNLMRCAPKTDRFFRPEEQHRRSREDDVIPPMRRRHGEMGDVRLRNRSIVFDFES